MATVIAPPVQQEKSFVQKHWVLLTTIIVALVLVIWGYVTNPQVTTAVLASALRQSTPLVLGALCGIFCERSGIVNIGIEGTMLFSAFIAFMANVYLIQLPIAESLGLVGTLTVAAVVGVLAGGLMGWLLAFMSVTLKMDQIIGGTVVNILAIGLTGYFYQQGLTTGGKFLSIEIPVLSDIPLLGTIFFDNPPITYLSLILIVACHFLLFRTRWGLRTRAVGEHPRAADTVGINVYFMRYANVILGGCLAGLAGAYLTLEAVGSFERGMTNGRGFVALAVMLFGKRTPFGAWGAALLFGLASAAQTQLQFITGQAGAEDAGFWGAVVDLLASIPHQFIGMLPYVLTILVLAGFVGRTRDPKALGQPYDK